MIDRILTAQILIIMYILSKKQVSLLAPFAPLREP